MAPQTMPAQNVPAWKRLGLKLKGPAGDGPSTPSAKPVATTNGAASTPNWGNKRKEYPSPSSQFSSSKRARTDFNQVAQTPGRRKSVTFADDTKDSDLDPSATKTPSKLPGAAEDKKKPKKPKVRKPAKKPEQNYKPDHLQPQLSQYLRDWHTARDSWKFRKNIQTLVIKYAFDPALLPATDFPIFRKYAIGLQGASRDWLRNSAAELRKKDLEQKGAAGFPTGTTDADDKQKRYEELVAKMLGPQGTHSRAGRGSSNTNGKRVRDDYSEEDLVMGGTEAEAREPEVTQRVVKRMRAEMVLEELCDAETSDATTSTTTTTTTSSASSEGGAATAMPSTEDAKAKTADSSQKRRRQRKKRTVDDDDDTSSSDESGESGDDEDEEDEEDGSDAESTSSSGTSSSGSDSDSSDDDTQSEGTLQRLAQEREALESSSSSSSSSSGSESGSDSDGESEL